MDLGLKNKVALVTGSSRGIGKAIASGLLAEGARVLITGRNQANLNQIFDEFSSKYGPENVLQYCGDLTERQEIEKCFKFVLEKWSKFDILVANIGSGKSSRGLAMEKSEWDRMFKFNFDAAVLAAQNAVPAMVESGGGSIVFIASIAGLEAYGSPLPYASAKAALIAYSKNLALRVAKDNIRVNSVAPGNIKFLGGRWEEIIKENPSVLETIKKEVPMARFGAPEEIANVVAFLASDKASFVTGACWIADGGQTKSI